MPVGCGSGNAEPFRRFFNRHADKITELDQFGFLFVLEGEFFQGLTHRENLILVLSEWESDFGELNSFELAAMSLCSFAPRIVHENPPHGFRRRSEKMGPVVPLPLVVFGE